MRKELRFISLVRDVRLIDRQAAPVYNGRPSVLRNTKKPIFPFKGEKRVKGLKISAAAFEPQLGLRRTKRKAKLLKPIKR